jgi:peroxiredoxin
MKTLLTLLVIGVFAMSSAASADLVIGAAAPTFTLSDMSGKSVDLAQYKGKIVVLEWTNPACPYVVGHYANGHMPGLQKKYTDQGVVWLTINSTNPDNQGAKSNEEYIRIYSEWNAAMTANLRDASGTVGKSYEAKTTPHMYVIDKNGVLVYAGAIDDDRSTDGGANAKTHYVTQAIDELSAGKSVSIPETKPYGCSVKY